MKRQKLTFGFSPCPNDTFIFDALVHHKIDTEGLEFDFIMEDVEQLNNMAFDQKIDITKISYYSFAQLLGKYEMMRSGGALGSNCGPLLIASRELDLSDLNNFKVAIPGFNTTANLLLTLAYPDLKNKEAILFSDIEDKVLNGIYDLGLIIHESRFTYQERGLIKIADLGEFWEKETKSPIPLGGICIHNSLDQNLKLKVENLIKQSVQYAFDNRQDTMPFVRKHAQAMNEAIMNAHIDLYVNDYSIELGEKGEKGVMTFLNHLAERAIIPNINHKVFV